MASPTPAQAVTINLNIGTNLGFRDVRRVDCRGRFYVYYARRGGSRFEIALSRHNGRVVDLRRIRN
jgi:plasmid stabilization system protein ParE